MTMKLATYLTMSLLLVGANSLAQHFDHHTSHATSAVPAQTYHYRSVGIPCGMAA